MSQPGQINEYDTQGCTSEQVDERFSSMQSNQGNIQLRNQGRGLRGDSRSRGRDMQRSNSFGKIRPLMGYGLN